MASMRRTIRSWHCWPCLMLVCAACSAQADSLAESKHEAADKLDAPQLVLRGHEKLKTDQDGAIADFTAAIELQPDLARAYEYRGLAKGMKGDLDGAIADFDETLRLNPESESALCNRGNARIRKNQYEEAIKDFTAALTPRPNGRPERPAQTYEARAFAKWHGGDKDGAIGDYTEAIRLQPDDALAYRGRANVKYATHDFEGALADFTDVLRLTPQSAEAHYDRGIARQALGDLKGAIADYTDALEIKTDHVTALENRFWSRLRAGQFQECEADASRLAELRPDDPHSLTRRGQLRALNGNTAGAREDFAKAARLPRGGLYPLMWSVGLGGPASDLDAFTRGSGWISSVARFGLGKLDPDELLAAAARSPKARDRDSYTCQAHFFIALFAEKNGDQASAREHYQACADTALPSLIECDWARARLAALARARRTGTSDPPAIPRHDVIDEWAAPRDR